MRKRTRARKRRRRPAGRPTEDRGTHGDFLADPEGHLDRLHAQVTDYLKAEGITFDPAQLPEEPDDEGASA